MGGICGFNWNDKELIHRMVNSIIHRGPDGTNYFIGNKVSLGYARLATIDLLKRSGELIHNEDSTLWIALNGVIYNYHNIRKNLEHLGHKFYTNTIAETILHSYEQYGYRCLNTFNGQFTFCIYDVNKKNLFLARDKFGIKPLYYYYKNNRFIFGSEIKAILQYDLEKKIKKEALREYFTYRFTIAPNTIFEDIYKLKPSHYIILNLETNEITLKSYFRLDIDLKMSIPMKEIAFITFKLLNQSVKLRMTADVPICTFLSGGIDSSIVTGLASQYNKNLNTFSVGFENSNELNYAKLVSDYFNTTHHEYILTNDDVIKEFDKMIFHIDEPIGDAAFLPVLFLSKQMSKKFKIALTGDAGDEVFGGYDKYKMFYYGRFISKFIPKIKINQEIIRRLSKLSELRDIDAYIETIRVFSDEDLSKLHIEPRKTYKYWIENLRTMQKMQFYDLNTSVTEDFNMKSDKMSMAFGVEQRFPFADERIIKFALSLPLKLKLRFWNEKFLLKKSFSTFLPKTIVKRRKRGFNTPMDDWFKTILKERFINLLTNKSHKLYNKEHAITLFKRLIKSSSNYKRNFLLSQKLWTIFVFEEWYNQVF
ncbi:MAG: asparagine synthase (glutamine-hydrolyzing) [Promethearchaeota archaeon]|nr:MAG: asparagine synthase (glutamine-hydrolyzing) [Candidatus Lokiarchaeota archaeon]